MTQGLLGTNIVTQIGFVVKDIEAAAKRFAGFLGVEKPAVIVTGAYEEAQTEYRGASTKARAKLAFFTVGPNLQLELIEPDQEPSTWREYLDEHGEGIHHIAFEIRGMREKIGVMTVEGMPLLQKGEYKGGRYAYLDATADLKCIVELLENG